MFKAIGKYLRSFFTKEEVLPEQIDVIFESVDIDRAVKTLKIKENAKEDGENETPDSNETNEGSTEMKINQFIATETSQRKQQFIENILSYDKGISESDINLVYEEGKNLGTLTKHEIESIVQEEKNSLVDSKDKLKDLKKDFNTFKTNNKLKHVPDYPESYQLYIAFLLAILLGETILNGIYFAQGSEYGILGGAIYALGIAAVNIAISFKLGQATTYKNHIKNRLKTLGFLSIFGVLAWVGVYNLLVAHYRQQIDVDIDNAGTLAVKLFIQSPFALDKFEYWVLFLVGLLFGLFAYTEGYLWDDRYPGYGKLYRRMEQSKRDWHADQEDIINRLEDLKLKKLDEFTGMQSDVKSTINYLKGVVGQKQAMVTNLENNIEQIESSSKILIKMYREINMVHRQTYPPKYFMEEIAPPDHATVETNIENDYARVKEQEKIRDEFIAMVEQIKNTIVDLYNKSIQCISNINLEANDKPQTPKGNNGITTK